MKNVSEVRYEEKKKLLDKWMEKIQFDGSWYDFLKPSVNINQGNFVPCYYSNADNDEYLAWENVKAIEYHIRMLKNTEEVIKNHVQVKYTVDEEYATNRIRNAIVLLENFRAESIYIIMTVKIEGLANAKTLKRMRHIDGDIDFWYTANFTKEGYVRPYIGDD